MSTILVTLLTILGIFIISCIVGQKSEGSSMQSSTVFRPRSGKSIMNMLIGFAFGLFCLISTFLSHWKYY